MDPGPCLEGGDFYPAGPGLAFLGVGMRTNFEAWDGTTDVHPHPVVAFTSKNVFKKKNSRI